MAVPDPRWLEILKASGWQTLAIAAGCFSFLGLSAYGLLPRLDPWMTQLAAIVGLICGFLAIASMLSAMFRFFPVQKWIVRAWRVREAKKAARDYIPFMTEQEKQIIAYLLAKNQKMFSAESDGGYAAPLLSRGIVVIAAQPGQHVTTTDVPMAIPDHVWSVLESYRTQFPYTKPNRRDGIEPYPWRIPWQLR